MITRIVRIGNSQGVRIPKPLIERAGLSGEVEIRARKGALLIRAAKKPRADWDQAFREMAAHGDDALIDGDIPLSTAWDDEEWTW